MAPTNSSFVQTFTSQTDSTTLHSKQHTLPSPPHSSPRLTSAQHTLSPPAHPPPLAMPRTPKSSSSQRCWSMLSFFSSGFSDRPTASTTTTSSGGGATKPSPKKKLERQEKGSAAAEGSTNDKKEDEEQSWIMLHDRDSTPFWFEKTTGYWTYDGITVYGPPAPITPATHLSYAPPGPLQQQTPPPQQQHVSSQYVSLAQPAAAYYAPGPYTATQYAWKPCHSAGRAAPGTILGAPGVFF